MFENDMVSIKKAQEGDKLELENLIKQNNRLDLEYCKKI